MLDPYNSEGFKSNQDYKIIYSLSMQQTFGFYIFKPYPEFYRVLCDTYSVLNSSYPFIYGTYGVGKSIFLNYLLVRWAWYQDLKNPYDEIFENIIILKNKKRKNNDVECISLFHRESADFILIGSFLRQISNIRDVQTFTFNYKINVKNQTCKTNINKTIKFQQRNTLHIYDGLKSCFQTDRYTKKLGLSSIGFDRSTDSLWETQYVWPLPTREELIEVSKLL
jgi:hypothetical protein